MWLLVKEKNANYYTGSEIFIEGRNFHHTAVHCCTIVQTLEVLGLSIQRDMAVIGLPSETSLGKVEPGFVVNTTQHVIDSNGDNKFTASACPLPPPTTPFMRVHARVRVLRGCAHARSRSGWHRTSTAAAARRAAERWTRHLRCNTRAIRVRMRVLCTSAAWMACTNKPDRAGGRVAHTRTPAFGGLPDPSHGIEPRLAPSCFCRFACCAPSPAAAQLRSCVCVQTDAC